MKSQLLAALTALVCVVVLSPNLTAGEDHEETRHRVKVVMTDSESEGAEVIRLEGDDLAVGESRQIITESGKEVVITRQEESFEITIDGEEIDVSSGVHGLHGSPFVQKILTENDPDGEGKSIMVIGAAGEHVDPHGAHNMIVSRLDGGVFISEDGETTEIDTEKIIEWAGKPHVMGLIGPGLSEHLDSSGAFDGLSDEQRQRIVTAISSYKGATHSATTKVIVLDVDEENAY